MLLWIYFAVFNLLVWVGYSVRRSEAQSIAFVYLVFGLCNFALDVIFLIAIAIFFNDLHNQYILSQKGTPKNKRLLKTAAFIVTAILVLATVTHSLGRTICIFYE